MIDVHAAGHGWLVDPTPSEAEELLLATDRPVAIETVLPSDHVDLLTAVAHELGGLVGLVDRRPGCADPLSPDIASPQRPALPPETLRSG